MDEEFGSFVVTDPDIVDPSIDVSGLRTQTDTSLLGNIPDFAGIQYEAFNPTRLTDLMRLYTTGLPMIDTPAAAVPPATGGGGSGDGGQATIPDVDLGGNTPEDQRLIDEGIGLQIAPGDPVVAPGEMPVTQAEMDEFNYPELTEEMSEVSIPANLDLIDLGNPTGDPRIVSEEMGLVGDIPDRGMGQIPVDTRVTEDFTKPTMADIAGDIDENLIDRGDPTGDPRIVSEEQGLVGSIPDRGRGEIATDEFDVTTDQFTGPTMADVAGPSDFTGASIQTEDLQTIDGEPIGYLGTSDAPPNIVTAKPPVGVVDPFDGKYTMSTAITPEDTEESITQKIANFLNVDTDKLNKSAVTSALNLVAGKDLDTVIPIATVFNLVKDVFVKSPEQEAAEEQARQDNIDEAAAITQRLEDEVTPQDIIDDRGRGEIPTRTEPEPTPTFEPPRGGGADIGRDDPAPSAPKSDPKPTPDFYQDPITTGGGGNQGDPGGKSIVCTAMYQTTGLEDWSKAMKIWYIYQKKYLTIQHQEGYHKLFKPFVKGMHKSSIIKAIGAHVARHRTQHLKHVMFNSKPSLLGKIYNKILEPICYFVGKHG